MPPVNSAPSSEVDHEATAELPVLDVAAYEARLEQTLDGNEEGHTDTWVLPANTFKPAYDLDHSGTHEMPPLPKALPPAAADAPAAARASERRSNHPAAGGLAVSVPPSPPLIEELRTGLAAAERRIEELNERARIADAERMVAVARANAECEQLRQQLASHLEALSSAGQRLGVQGADQVELQAAFDDRGDLIEDLKRKLESQTRQLASVQTELAASQRRAEVLDCDSTNLRATVARRESQIRMLEADLAARQQREAELKLRLDQALASVNPDIPELHREISQREARLADLKAELELARARQRDKDGDLDVAEENIRQLETELRDKTRKLTEANVTVEEWRAVIAESQRSILERDGRIQKLEAELQQHRFAATLDSSGQTSEEVALEGPARVLIRTDGNTDFVHVLGRRTRIGRGSDNELVLDTKHISRYHAVVLAGPVHTSIEDLNSTNGVFVNGKRITRQVLQDGDRVTVGKTQFRYTVRD